MSVSYVNEAPEPEKSQSASTLIISLSLGDVIEKDRQIDFNRDRIGF